MYIVIIWWVQLRTVENSDSIVLLTSYFWGRSWDSVVEQRKCIRCRGAKFVCSSSKQKDCQIVLECPWSTVVQFWTISSTGSESGSWLCTITVPVHGLLPQAFLLIIQAARYWAFQLATVHVLYICCGMLLNPHNECVLLLSAFVCHMSKPAWTYLRQLHSEARYLEEVHG